MSDHNDSVESMDDMDLLCEDMDGLMDMTELDDLPSSIMVTSMDPSIFSDSEAQAAFENLFRELDKNVSFIYLKNFKRARLQFSTSDLAAVARIRYDGVTVCGQSIRCYFIQIQQSSPDNNLLQPPKPQRMFLISPPASPPVGWESVPEAEPVINYDLLHAIAKLNPGETHEVHPPTVSAPSIVVHLCDDPDGFPQGPGIKPKIVQTKRPDAGST